MNHTRPLAVPVIFCMIAFLVLTSPIARASVENNWPAGKHNIPRNPTDIYLDFEAGIEGITIQSSIPSLRFTTTSGLDWQYGDIRTGKWNVYPYGSQSYETIGNFFAWLGMTGNSGRIDFLGGGATYASALVSTYSGVVIDAYDANNTLIATSGWAGNNINTRTLTRLTVEAPAGQFIAYVMIHDTGNYWLMDEFCTDANQTAIPVPGRAVGTHADKFDLVFVPDADYGAAADINTWLATFLANINAQIDQRLGGQSPVTGNLNKFNFYYTRQQGNATNHTLPANLRQATPFADAYVILHTQAFGDYTAGSPPIFGAEGPLNLESGRSFIHEGGHGIFGLADEYDGPTAYFMPNPFPNIWSTQAGGRADASNEYRTQISGERLYPRPGSQILFGPVSHGNSANATTAYFADTDVDGDIDTADVTVYINGARQNNNQYLFSTSSGVLGFVTAPPNGAVVTIDYSHVIDEDWNPVNIMAFAPRLAFWHWYKLGTSEYIMFDGSRFANGWGKPGARRIQWFLDQYADGTMAAAAMPQTERSIVLNLQITGGVFSLLGDGFMAAAPPNYLPGEYPFEVKVFSITGTLLGEYGINDPRMVMAESGYVGPLTLDDINFQLVLPYFGRGGRVDIIESASGNVVLSADISRYATPTLDSTPPNIAIVSPPSGYALQDGVTFKAQITDDESGVAAVRYSVREANGGSGSPIGFEDLVPNYDSSSGIATLQFDTLQLPDGNYVLFIQATDLEGNSNSLTVPYTIRNWAVLTLLPKTASSRAGRSMPLKFSLRVSSAVDSAQPFVYNEELEVSVASSVAPDVILQRSVFGSKSRDYRIDETAEQYISNFQTSKVPMTYIVTISRAARDFVVGSFIFSTVK